MTIAGLVAKKKVGKVSLTIQACRMEGLDQADTAAEAVGKAAVPASAVGHCSILAAVAAAVDQGSMPAGDNRAEAAAAAEDSHRCRCSRPAEPCCRPCSSLV